MVLGSAVRRRFPQYRRHGFLLLRVDPCSAGGAFGKMLESPRSPINRTLRLCSAAVAAQGRSHRACYDGPTKAHHRVQHVCLCRPPARSISSKFSGDAKNDAEKQEQQRHRLSPGSNGTRTRHLRDTTAGVNNSNNSSNDEGSLVLRVLGPRWRPYGRLARLDKPSGTMLLLLPCWWSIALAAPMHTLPDARMLALFATGAFVMRSAGCTINDLWDRDLDRKVARTKARPLASGELGTTQAILFLGGQLTLGLGVLLSLNFECIKLGFAAMPLVVAYPLMKRYTNWPQAVLGLTFNWGAIMGWAAVHGSISWPHVLPLYGAGVCWTIVYDTLYGHQDKEDDKRLGIRSTALLFGDQTKPILAGFAAAAVGLLGTAGYEAGLSWPFYAGTAAAAGHLAWQIGSADLEDPPGLFKRFKSNQEMGTLVFASIVCGHF